MSRKRQLLESLEERILLNGAVAGVESFAIHLPVGGGNLPAGQSGSFTLPQFDSLGGRRVLLSVEMTLDAEAFGQYTLDSEFDIPGAQVLNLHAGEIVTVDSVLMQGPDPLLHAEANPGDQVTNVPLPVDSDGAPDFVGNDIVFLNIDGQTDSDSDAKTAVQADLSPFVGTGTVGFTFTSQENNFHDSEGDVEAADTVPFAFNMDATITYRYIDIVKSVISVDAFDDPGAFAPDPVGPPGITFTAPGAAGVRFQGGSITSANIGHAIDSDLFGVRAVFGPRQVSFAIVLTSGQDGDGVFDARIHDVLPSAGYSVPSGGINLRVSYGDGTVIPALADAAPGAVSYSLIGGTLFGAGGGLRLNDPTGGAAIRPLDAETELNGHNIVIVTYDLAVNQTFRTKELTNTATWFNAAISQGGPDATAIDPSDPATVTTVPFDDPFFSSEHRYGTIEPYEPVHPRMFTPVFTGTGAPGSFLRLELYNSRDELIGSTTVPVDAGGNWLASLPDAGIDLGPHNVVLRQTFANFNAFEDTGYNLRLYYQPAIMGGTYVSEYLTTENVTGIRTVPVSVNSLYLASMYPLAMGWSALPYEQLPILSVQ